MHDEPWNLSWSDWLETKTTEQRAEAKRLLETFARLGATDHEGWVRSEIDEDIAQLARYLVLADVSESVTKWRDLRGLVAKEERVRNASPGLRDLPPSITKAILESDIDEALLTRFALEVATDTLFALLDAIDREGPSGDLGDDLPCWRLVETTPDGEPTGRDVGGLHESVFEFLDEP